MTLKSYINVDRYSECKVLFDRKHLPRVNWAPLERRRKGPSQMTSCCCCCCWIRRFDPAWKTAFVIHFPDLQKARPKCQVGRPGNPSYPRPSRRFQFEFGKWKRAFHWRGNQQRTILVNLQYYNKLKPLGQREEAERGRHTHAPLSEMTARERELDSVLRNGSVRREQEKKWNTDLTNGSPTILGNVLTGWPGTTHAIIHTTHKKEREKASHNEERYKTQNY
jgi:hypothetical protein